MTTHLETVIEIGSTGIRMTIAEISKRGTWEIVDHSELPLSLGWDVSTTGKISRDSLLQCLKILNRFKEQLNGWSIDKEHIIIFATSAFREAQNRDSIMDRILVKTGLKIRVIDGIEENRLMYVAVMDSLSGHLSKFKKANSLIIEVGGASTELMLLAHGKIAAAHSLRLGTVLIEHQIKSMMGSEKSTRRYLEDIVSVAGENLSQELNLERVKRFIAVGPDALLAAKLIGKQTSEKIWSIERKDFDTFVDEIQKYTIEECIERYNISYREAHAFNIYLLIYKLFIDLTKTEEILVPINSLREGYIISKVAAPNLRLQKDFANQIEASALNLARRYRIDEPHAMHVQNTSLILFDKLKTELGLHDETRRILSIAALLHDIGMFIRNHDHHIHSFYILSHSEIFGLSKENMQMISHIARCHRSKRPNNTDMPFAALTRETRTTVLKLAAILRVADALDRSHAQHIKKFNIELTNENLILTVQGTQDITLEKTALLEKGDLFESLFGYTVLLT